MYKNIVLLFIPFFFTFVLNIAFDFFNFSNNKKINSIKRTYVTPIEVHKNYQTNNYPKNFLNYKDKIQTTALANIDLALTRTNIVHNKIQKNIIHDHDSSTINKIYSEKFIHKDLLTYSKLTNLVENKLQESVIKKSKKRISNYSLQFVSSNWKKNFSEKKANFIETVLPLISFENQRILFERQRLIEIKNYLQVKKTLVQNDLMYLNQLTKKYHIESENIHKIDLIEKLLFSVDVIPNSIVLAQAVNESGWGTSRFAREYNSLFGQYTYDINNGVVPYEREEGKKHLIRNFTSINKSVESYFQNINTHYAYHKFRKVRSQIHRKDLNKNIKLLTETLDVYAEDKLYVETLNAIIDTNNFFQFDLIKNLFFDS